MLARFLLLAAIGSTIGLGIWLVGEQGPKNLPTADTPFDSELLRVAADYKNWGRVDFELAFAVADCRLPAPGRAYASASNDETTHGKKLYSLLTNKLNDYQNLEKGKDVPVGFAIVKESWASEEVTDSKLIPAEGIDQAKVIITPGTKDSKENRPAAYRRLFYPYAFEDGKCFKAVKQADLFIMLKLDPETPDADDGWVYATMTADGKTVTAAGKIESCMNCHRQAKSNRLFGLAR